MGSKRNQTLKSLSSGRPPTARSSRSMSRKASRALINTHHQLEKRRRQAAVSGDEKAEATIAAELSELGGLSQYQQASLQGQSLDRGGDTSKVLLEWLPISELKAEGCRLRMLEVGALSTRNACSTSGIFDVAHIDLHSQEPNIQQQDFMERPWPNNEADKFDIISMSLVLNFVPDAAARGEMLLRISRFLRGLERGSAITTALFPSLFMVLPRSCVANSRYFTEKRLELLMTTLGYEKIRTKITQKLVYSLWRRVNIVTTVHTTFPKQEINPGRTRNNFAISLKRPARQPA